ncbi:PspC domain-containing protein [Flavobacteriaceae bacterium]|nr:PspC domain-containing protein [Flavobacteriaceae bacterium]MDC1472094.1 PspC domain-containing protein [Flavobacteriaceae bacterium]MDC1539522.1 PspC domain-containing protein [Flavobacteriaceae bacterium]
MNKTVSINLAGIFFHIDEGAYQNLKNYFKAIKKSLQNSEGESEILADIEGRVSELFSERIKSSQHVISNKEVDEIVSIMGQPEDYKIDEAIFEESPEQEKSDTHKRRLFRDSDGAYVGGVSAGLGHYFGIDPLLIRLVWVLLIFGAGMGPLLYVILWILIPAAKTTAEKLAMMGKPVTISNIEKKVQEEFENVKASLERVKNSVNSDKINDLGSTIQSKSRSFFETLCDIAMFLFKLFFKAIGLLFIVVSISALIGFFISLLTVGIADAVHFPGLDFADLVNSSTLPLWLVSILALLIAGIPIVFLLLLGLRMVSSRTPLLNRYTKLSLFGVWIIVLITLITFSLKLASDYRINASVTEQSELPVTSQDTLFLEMKGNPLYSKYLYRENDLEIIYDAQNTKRIYGSNVRLIVRSTKDSVGSISVEKIALGSDYFNAKNRAEKLEYDYEFKNNTLFLNGFFLTDIDNKYRGQNVEVILTLPIGSVLFPDDNTYSFHRNTSKYNDILDNGNEEHFMKVNHKSMRCLDCSNLNKN